EVSVKLRSSLIDGSATFTIVVSSTIIKTPKHRTINASQRLRQSMSLVMPVAPVECSVVRSRVRRADVARLHRIPIVVPLCSGDLAFDWISQVVRRLQKRLQLDTAASMRWEPRVQLN